MVTEPNPLFLDGTTPTVSLAGKDWPIPMLAPKQLRHVVPALMKVAPKIMAILQGRSKLILDETTGVPTNPEAVMKLMQELDQPTFDGLCQAVYWALTRAHPKMTYFEFEDMPIRTEDLFKALDVISGATGMMTKKKEPVAPGLPPLPESSGDQSKANGTTSSPIGME